MTRERSRTLRTPEKAGGGKLRAACPGAAKGSHERRAEKREEKGYGAFKGMQEHEGS